MEENSKRKYCFTTILRWLTIFALPIEPLNMSTTQKILYGIYCIIFLTVFPVGYVVSQILQISRVSDDMKLVSFIISYVFSDSLGKIKKKMRLLHF